MPDQLFEYIVSIYKKFGYELQEVNLFGIRNNSDLQKDVFNDKIGVLFKGKSYIYQGTTDPGKASIEKGGVNGNGAPFLVLGQHKKMYCVDKHANKYEALCNRIGKGCSPQVIQRDRNRNFKIDDYEETERGYFGMNLHRASMTKELLNIGAYSEGCQVIRKYKDFLELMKTVKSSDMYRLTAKPTLFHYTLFSIEQLHGGI